MQQTTDKAFGDWTDFYKGASELGRELMWPSETLIRMMRGNYVPGVDKNYAGKSALDVGFGSGNNLLFLGSLGMKLHGIEVSKDICDQTHDKLLKFGHDADLRQGSNRSLVFEDNKFDVLVSWNVIHYDNTDADMRAALVEYARVLKPGGRFFLSTVAPENKILEKAKVVGAHRYQIAREDDFRKGEVFFCFDSPGYVEHYFGEHFADVRVGRVHDYLFTEMLDWFVVTGVKR